MLAPTSGCAAGFCDGADMASVERVATGVSTRKRVSRVGEEEREEGRGRERKTWGRTLDGRLDLFWRIHSTGRFFSTWSCLELVGERGSVKYQQAANNTNRSKERSLRPPRNSGCPPLFASLSRGHSAAGGFGPLADLGAFLPYPRNGHYPSFPGQSLPTPTRRFQSAPGTKLPSS